MRAALLLLLFLAGCSGRWEPAGFKDEQAVARFIYDRSAALVEGRMRAEEAVERLQDRRVVFIDGSGVEVCVRDLAFTVLYEAGAVEPPFASAKVKLICSCKVKGELFRFYVPELSESDFTTVIRALGDPKNR